MYLMSFYLLSTLFGINTLGAGAGGLKYLAYVKEHICDYAT